MGTYPLACARPRTTLRALILLALLGLCAPGSGCSRSADAALPTGAFLGGDAAALRSIFRRLEGLEGTPIARAAQQLRVRLATCDEASAFSPDGRLAALVDELGCGSSGERPAALGALRGDADLGFLIPVGETARLSGSADVAVNGTVTLDARLHGGGTGGLLGLVLPSDRPPGPSVLSGRDTLFHARVRAANGLNVAALVPEGSQADRLFRLKSELFLGSLLDGTWEAAVYMPEEARLMPPLALAIGFRVRAGAVAALEKFISNLEATWPVHRSAFSVGENTGACLLDLRILPEFAPCYVAGQRSIAIGWNPPSLRRALAPSGAPGLGERGGVVVHLDRFRAADERLRRAIAPDSPAPRVDYVWEKLTAHGIRDDGAVRLRLTLLAGAPAS